MLPLIGTLIFNNDKLETEGFFFVFIQVIS